MRHWKFGAVGLAVAWAGCAAGAAGSAPISSSVGASETVAINAQGESGRKPFAWPNGKLGAVSLTYDDAIASQRTHAAEQLREFGLNGTFFLKGASEDLVAHREQWVALLSAGHEFGSHTMHHPCDRKFDWVPQGYASQDYDLVRMRTELETSRKLLEDLGAPSPYTFAYPCGEQTVGETRESYAPLVRELFSAARGFNSRAAKAEGEELNNIPTVDGAQPFEKLLELIEQTQRSGNWLVITFHGVGGDYLSVELDAHRRLLAELKARAAQLWVAPFGRVAAHIRSQRK